MTSPTDKGFNAGREPANKGKKYPPEVLTADEVRGLIEACSSRAPTGIRNRALIVAMYRGGLRVGETLALRPKTWTQQQGPSRCSTAKATVDGSLALIRERWPLSAAGSKRGTHWDSTDMYPCSAPSRASH